MTVGNEVYACEEFIYNLLSVDSTLLAQLPGGTLANIFNGVAPYETVDPWVSFDLWIPPEDIRGVGGARVGINAMYVVRGVCRGASYTPLKVIAGRIDALLHQAPIANVTDGVIFSSQRHMPFSMEEVQAGQQYRHRGGIYMIQAQG